MEAIIYIVRTVLQTLLVTVFLLRFLLPLVRADSRNQLSQAVIRITNPIVLPLRRVIPPFGRIDTASLVALALVQLISTAVVLLLIYGPVSMNPLFVVQHALSDIANTVIQFYFFAMIIYALLSWVAPGAYSPAANVLTAICEPILKPVRRVIPAIAGLDLSVFFVLIGLRALLYLVP
jgi:YggT family protein